VRTHLCGFPKDGGANSKNNLKNAAKSPGNGVIALY